MCAHSILSNSLRPHGLYLARLRCLWDFPSKNIGSQLPFPTPGDLSDPGTKPTSSVSPALAGGFFTPAPPGNPLKDPSLIGLGPTVKTSLFNYLLEVLISKYSYILSYWLVGTSTYKFWRTKCSP